MVKDFKKNAVQLREAEQRKAVPQVDPERSLEPAPANVAEVTPEPAQPKLEEPQAASTGPRIALVDKSQPAGPSSISMYPSRKEQLRDLAYIERRNPWEIIEDALEEYVVKRYGKNYARRANDERSNETRTSQ